MTASSYKMNVSILKVFLIIEVTFLLEIGFKKHKRLMKAFFGRWHNLQNHPSEYISNKLF